MWRRQQEPAEKSVLYSFSHSPQCAHILLYGGTGLDGAHKAPPISERKSTGWLSQRLAGGGSFGPLSQKRTNTKKYPPKKKGILCSIIFLQTFYEKYVHCRDGEATVSSMETDFLPSLIFLNSLPFCQRYASCMSALSKQRPANPLRRFWATWPETSSRPAMWAPISWQAWKPW